MSYSQNTDIITQISEYVALLGKPFFQQNIQSKLHKKFAEFIKSSDTAFIDKYGRATFFYVDFDGIQIPFYQPGTFTLNSSIKEDQSDLVVCHDGCQQNGPILGMGCALFIARFMATLAQNYARMKAQSEEQINQRDEVFNFEIYKVSLLATLNTLSPEDATQHGRLLEMRDWLLNFSSQKVVLEPYEEVFFYLKELQKLNRIKDFSEGEINNSKFTLTTETLKQLQNLKQQARLYCSYDKYFKETSTKSLFHSDQFEELKNLLLQKKGIFLHPEEDHQQLQEFLVTVKEGRKFLVSNSKQFQQNARPVSFKLSPGASYNNNPSYGSMNSLHEDQNQNVAPLISTSYARQPAQQQQVHSKQRCELPVQSLTIPEDFLSNVNVPKYLRRGFDESEHQYIRRAYNFLRLLSKQELVFILSIVDPSRKDMKDLLKLTSIVLENVVNK